MVSRPQHIVLHKHNEVLAIEVVDQRLNEEAQVEAWKNETLDAIRGNSPTGVIIDLKHVEYITSIAIFPFVEMRSVANEVRAKLILCNLSETVAKVLTVTQLIVESRDHAKRLVTAGTLEDALRMLGQ